MHSADPPTYRSLGHTQRFRRGDLPAEERDKLGEYVFHSLEPNRGMPLLYFKGIPLCKKKG